MGATKRSKVTTVTTFDFVQHIIRGVIIETLAQL
jgi:hypothetical protein